jgi:primosomal protein N' (replication factor Y)
VETINLKRYHTPGGILSPQLCQAIREVLAARQQVILFLNRRGFSTVILCPDCGRTVHCPHCRVSLTYHRAENRVLCHHCGFAEPAPEICPGCGGAAIRLRGYGTEKVETEIRRYFPDARIGRLDRDTTARKGSHLRIVDDFRSQETDILIGTQMVAKGFDFPQVTLVGVINADVALNLPDFRSAERTFQLIAQVSGRSGRGDQPGRVIVQTYHPEHYGLVAAAGHDYESFYAQEIDFRREPTYPPFARLANILITTAKEADAKTFATDLAARYLAKSAEMGDAVEVLGPVPAPLSKVKGKYRWHLLLRAATHEALTGLIRATHAELTVPRKISLAVDIDPVSLM